MTAVKKKVEEFGFPRLIILAFLLLLFVMLFVFNIPVPLTISQCLVRVGINLVSVFCDEDDNRKRSRDPAAFRQGGVLA